VILCIDTFGGSTNLGNGSSIKAEALSCASKEIVAYMDIDLSAHPSVLSALISHIDDHDIVIGSGILRGHLPRVKSLSQIHSITGVFSVFNISY
jgi:hypothetical protein